MAYVNTSVGSANTDLDDFVPQLWSKGINDYISEQFVLANIVDTSLSALVQQKGDVVNIPLMTEKSATATTPAAFSAITDNLTYQVFAELTAIPEQRMFNLTGSGITE